ncbi:MAG TPA: Gfo/Idh/MocA family oxidoreductase [Terriglobales bacterium]|nr:Gfo/Idh/MocA family oxidoreductase [Terriglobales bacterium]
MAKQMAKLNVAMIGCGFMGRAHSNAFRQVGCFFDMPYELRPRVACARKPDVVENFARQWGWEEAQTDWQSVVTRKDIDVVDIGVPNHLHAPIALAAAQAGKIVLCEKPLAMNLAEAERMAAAARKVATLVWFNYRRVPAIALAKQLVEQGKIGKPYHYRATYLQSWGGDPDRAGVWRFRRSEAGSGVVGDLLSHALDLALLLNGTITEVSSLMQTFVPNREVDDAVLLLARFANGSIGSFEATRFATACRNRNSFEIHGSQGAIRFNLEDLNRLEVFDKSDAREVQGYHNLLVTGPGHPYVGRFWPPGHILGYEHTFIASLADFLECLASQHAFHPNFDDAVDVHRLLEAVESSAQTRSWTSVGTAPERTSSVA